MYIFTLLGYKYFCWLLLNLNLEKRKHTEQCVMFLKWRSELKTLHVLFCVYQGKYVLGLSKQFEIVITCDMIVKLCVIHMWTLPQVIVMKNMKSLFFYVNMRRWTYLPIAPPYFHCPVSFICICPVFLKDQRRCLN